jgi:hypothetical protein
MPGTDMGPNATYKNPESVKANLLQPVVEKVKARGLAVRSNCLLKKTRDSPRELKARLMPLLPARSASCRWRAEDGLQWPVRPNVGSAGARGISLLKATLPNSVSARQHDAYILPTRNYQVIDFAAGWLRRTYTTDYQIT